ncbi:hypothetical protein K438DRAFT_545958 [Mycena galopus ATCC 62051]|nr:hypothetical protein K438DRAFT_545958 [Mycena galopus ATCC 62051]
MGVSPAVAAPQHDKAESATVQSTFAASRRHPPQHRVSHPVVSSTSDHDQQPPTPMYTDVYSHPAAVAYAAAHPRRTIPKFGPYLLLQTLGEGEFGKVKLGLHIQWGEEVAIKLIRRGNVDTAVRMSKVEREIEVLRILRHPNIVRLYDVIETDKFIGIIIEYASGGELFDHILAHRYLRERDASKLFSQLISGVWYIHQKKIVHRDLKLENLLLDRHRNVIINDFGFANRFEHRADDLMQTSCGSPCYAAPELVISEGLYVGSAVDIWSCGVILYAMLAGYLPFDDDPANPDGDNINLLYKYIVNTPLSFPKYISDEARGLLKMMLVPDPRKRASLDDVMRHPWLAAYHMPRDDDEGAGPVAFGRTVDELEKAAMDQHRMKRLAYQRQMRAAAPTPPQPSIRRTMTEMLPTQSSGQAQNQVLPPPAQKSASGAGAPEFLYDSAYGAGGDDDDPFGPAPGSGKRAVAVVEESVETKGETPRGKGKEKQREEDTKDKFRHTIQIEYDARRGQRAAGGSGASPAPPTPVQDREREREHERSKTPTQTQSQSAAPPTPTPPHAVVLPLPSLVAAPPSPPAVNGAGGSPSAASIAERRERRQRGSTSSVNANAAGKPLPPSPTSPTSPPTTWKRMHEPTERVVGPSEVVNANVNWMAERPAVVDVLTDEQKEKAQAHAEGAEKEKEKETEKEADAEKEKEKERKEKEKEGKKSQRNTLTGLTVIVNPFTRRSRMREPSTNTSASPPTQLAPPVVPALPNTGSANKTFDDGPDGMKGRTNKARKVIQWIHKGRDSLTVPGPTSGVPSPAESMADSADTGDATSPVQVFVTTPAAAAAAGGAESLRIHHGAMDQGTVTTRQPPEVMRHVKEVLIGMGVEIFVESEYKYRCIRAKQRRNSKSTVGGSTGPGAPGGVGTFTMVGSSGSNGADKTLPLQSFFSGGAMLRGLLMPWESSQVSTAPSSTLLDGDDSLSASGILSAETASQVDTVYGTSVEDAGDEVRFSVELTRLNLLHDTYSLDIRRLKGNLRSYKFLYETLRKRADLQRQC